MRSSALVSSARGICCSPFRATAVAARRPVVEVLASGKDDKKKPDKKRTDPAVKRAMLAVERRQYNKSRKSACNTRIKKVLKEANIMMKKPLVSEEEVKPLELLVSEAYKELDKAVAKSVLHKNTVARRKARIAKYKRWVLLSAGLWVPPEDHPDYKRYQEMQAKKGGVGAATTGN